MYVRKSDGAAVKFEMQGDGLIKVQFGDEPAQLMCWSEFINMVTLVNG